MKKQLVRLSSLITVTLAMLGFVNCGVSEMFTTHTGMRKSLKIGCAADLQRVFGQTYYPFMRANCTSCHQHLSSHASADISVAFDAFLAKGPGTIDSRATNPHGGNNLDPVQMQNQIAGFKEEWNQGEIRYDNCGADSGFDVSQASTLRLNDKFMSNLETTRTTADVWTSLTWDLSSDPTLTSAIGKVKGTFSIEVRYLMNNGLVEGLLFRNPTIKLDTTQESVAVYGINVRLNGTLNPFFTTYKTLDQQVPMGSTKNLAAGLNPAMAPDKNASTSMKVGIELLRFQVLKAK